MKENRKCVQMKNFHIIGYFEISVISRINMNSVSSIHICGSLENVGFEKI